MSFETEVASKVELAHLTVKPKEPLKLVVVGGTKSQVKGVN